MFLRISVIAVFIFAATSTFAQQGNTLKILVTNHDTGEPVAEAKVSVKGTEITWTTDPAGRSVISSIPDGEQTIVVESLGYTPAELTLSFPLADSLERIIELELTNELAEVTIESTRSGRTIEAEPTRVEAIDEEEIEEKINMRPANVSMVLNESTGIKVQQTSATSATQSIRIQGLDGRYTQMLKDGFPSFGGFAGSQSLLEIPPLDLRQVEIIKGPAATFYGEGAIAGVVNFISKSPGEEAESTLLLNQTSALGSDASLFTTRKLGRFGYTFLGQFNYQNEYDVDDDGFSDLPRTYSLAISPRAFFYIDEKTQLTIGNSTTYQNRKGGDMSVIRGNIGPQNIYFEKNVSVRNVTTANFTRELAKGRRFVAKQSITFFDRDLKTPGYNFAGTQLNSYTDIAFFAPVKNHALVFGFTAAFDRFDEANALPDAAKRDELRASFGGFVQDTMDLTDRLSIEAGLRVDGTRYYGAFALPRVSVLYRFTENLTSRIGFGLGYKTPTIFTEDSETLLFRGVLPIEDGLKAERSRGGTFDLNYRATIADSIGLSLNQMFFYTQITDPLVLEERKSGEFAYANADSSVISRGFETNLRADYNIAKLFIGYTYTDAKAGYLPGNRILPLTPKSKINSSLIFEEHDSFKAGIEAHFTGRQTLSDRTSARSYTVVGIFGEKIFKNFSLFINAENITDVRQSRYSQVVFPPFTTPTFAEVYTHLEGRVFNGGIKIRF
ncbi:MAG: TonB-dependent receptor [Acidobacteria bacterium]|nr:TonB-dependent receptor [Acidobacteriota bacterium]